MMKTKGSSTNFNSYKHSITPAEDALSQKNVRTATPSSTPHRNAEGLGKYDYKTSQDNVKQRLNNKTPGGGKIILKKINQFTDHIKLNKTYMDENMPKLHNESAIKIGKKSNMQKYD